MQDNRGRSEMVCPFFIAQMVRAGSIPAWATNLKPDSQGYSCK